VNSKEHDGNARSQEVGQFHTTREALAKINRRFVKGLENDTELKREIEVMERALSFVRA